MLKKNITFEDFEGKQVSEVHYFNLTQTEAIAIALDLPDGVLPNDEESIDVNEAGRKFVEKLGGKGVFEFIKELVIKSYGVKVDNRRFDKSDKIREEFEQSLAYDAMMMELLSNDLAAAEFVNGVLPASLAEKVGKMQPGGNLIAPVPNGN